MKVGIAGAGAIAMGYAAFLQRNGHAPALWSPGGTRTAALRDGASLTVTGAIEGSFRPYVSPSAADLAQNEVIVLALPANGHRQVLDSLVPHLAPHHTVIISSHLSFAAEYLAKRLAERSVQIRIVAWSTTALTAKAPSATEVKIGAIRAKVDMATIPQTQADRAYATCVALFGDRFVQKEDMLTIALSNTNPEVHLGLIIGNLTRVELGEVWKQRSNMTPTVARLIEALDRERLAIAAAFGKKVRSITDHYEMSFGAAGSGLAEKAAYLAGQGKDPLGPKTLETRYISEDVPFGLLPTITLAEAAGVAVPIHRSGIEILSACCGCDLTQGNDLIAEIEVKDLVPVAGGPV